MNHLIAKTKGRNGDFFKVISNEEIFEFPEDLQNSVEYNTDYNLEEDEWFAIESFSERDYCIELLTRRFISTDYNQIPVASYNSIEYMCAYQTGIYYFQKLSASQIIRKKYFSLSDAPSIVENAPIIIIDTYPDAIYNKRDDILYFKSLSSISSIFRGIDQLYKEATQQETEEFLENEFILLGNGYSADKVKKANRKRIALAMTTLEGFSQAERSNIFNYIREYCESLAFDEDQENFTITCEVDLKNLLYGIEQRYYTTRFGGEKRLANSVITL